MDFKDCDFYNEIILGKPKTIGKLTFIPILDISFEGYNKFGYLFSGSISPKAFIVIDSVGAVSFYNFSADTSRSEL